MVKMKKTAQRDFQYEIRVAGESLLKGDGTSIAVIFANLNGRNFAHKKPGSEGNHSGYLSYMREQTSHALRMGDSIEMLNPEGKTLNTSYIGDGLVALGATSEQASA